MASIIKRNSKYSVVYYADVDGKRKQIWETFSSHKEATKRKAEVELEIEDGIFIAPNRQTISVFMDDFVALYGEENWALSTYAVLNAR